MRDITLMPNDYIVTHIKTDTICEHFSNDDVVYAVDERIIPLVRCKDCKHNPKYTNDYMYGGCVFCCEDDFYSGTPNDDFFCGFGERKGE